MPHSNVNGNTESVSILNANNDLTVHNSDNVTSVVNEQQNSDTLDFLKNKKLSELTPEQLRYVEDAAKRERKEKAEAALFEAWQFFVEAAQDADLSVIEAVNICEPSLTKGGKKTGVVKYRNPLNKQQSWRGLGRKPKWFRENLENGMSEEEMKV